MITVGSLSDWSINRLNSAGASLRPLRSPVAPKITIAVGSGLRRFVETVPRISPTTEELGGLRLGCSAMMIPTRVLLGVLRRGALHEVRGRHAPRAHAS